MKEMNRQTRGINAPTDILSFSFQDNIEEPGVFGKVMFDVPDFYNLGDMLIDVEYVKRRCDEDRKLHVMEGRTKPTIEGILEEGEVISEHETYSTDKEDDDDDSDEIQVEVDEWDDRGVAPAMQYIYDHEIRIHMLIVHGMLHLVGFDHIEDDDYELMVIKEDEVLTELRKRLGDDFGIVTRVLS